MIIEIIDHEIRKILPPEAQTCQLPAARGRGYVRESNDPSHILRKYVHVEVSYPPGKQFRTRVVSGKPTTPDGSCIAFRYCIVYTDIATKEFNRWIDINDPNNDMNLNIALVGKWLSDWSEEAPGGTNA